MKIVKNNTIPFKGFTAMTLWPFIFIRKDEAGKFGVQVERHENIHGRQQKEMLILGAIIAVILAVVGCGWWSLIALPLFFWWYCVEWLVRLCIYRNKMTAYKNIAFEREAYDKQYDLIYLDQRDVFAWIRYIKQ